MRILVIGGTGYLGSKIAVMFLASDDATAFHGSLVDVTSGILD